MPGERNHIIIAHKMKKINTMGLQLQLRELIFEERIQKLKKYDDLDVHDRENPELTDLK